MVDNMEDTASTRGIITHIKAPVNNLLDLCHKKATLLDKKFHSCQEKKAMKKLHREKWHLYQLDILIMTTRL